MRIFLLQKSILWVCLIFGFFIFLRHCIQIKFFILSFHLIYMIWHPRDQKTGFSKFSLYISLWEYSVLYISKTNTLRNTKVYTQYYIGAPKNISSENWKRKCFRVNQKWDRKRWSQKQYWQFSISWFYEHVFTCFLE